MNEMALVNGCLRLSSIDINCDDINIENVHDITCQGKVIKVLHPGECRFAEI